MKTIKRIISFAMVLCMLFGTMTVSAQAAVAWPSMSSSAYCEFTAAKTIYVYRNTACTTRGTVSPAKSYNAYIDPGDVCKIYQITSSYMQVAYPTSSGYKIGYIKRGDVFSVSAPTRVTTATGKATTYKKVGGASYGYFESGDKVYAVGTSGNYTGVIYTAKSGSRAWKFGWVTTANYNAYAGVTPAPDNNTGSTWRYPMTNAYVCGNNWLTYYSARPSRPYHLGLDLASRSGDANVYAAAAGTVAAVGTNNSNGKYVIVKHTLSGKTVYSFYCHLNSCNVATGNSVSAGTKIGVYGNTGSSSAGAHLHFAITNTLWTGGGYYGYGTSSSGNAVSYSGVTYYNPTYVIQYQKLP